MKVYIMYIVPLLATLALPAQGQKKGQAGRPAKGLTEISTMQTIGSITEGDPDTKAAPAPPAMLYKLTVNTVGGNHGTYAVTDKQGKGDGIVFLPPDTLVYGGAENADHQSNSTKVTLTVAPNDRYITRKGYPKAYKTGDTGTKVTILGDNIDEGGFTGGNLDMPPHPVTIEIAYAALLQGFKAITLTEDKSTAADVITYLDKTKTITVTLPDKGSATLAVTGFTYEAADNNGQSHAHDNKGTDGAFNDAEGAVNVFRFILAAVLPDEIVDAETPLLTGLVGKVKVANRAQPFVPMKPDKGITISGGTGDNLNCQTEDEAASKPFDGTIGKDDATTTVKSLEVSGDVKDATLTLSNVSVSGGNTPTDNKTTIKDGANVTIKLEGNNILGNLTVDGGTSLILHSEAGATLTNTKIENAGTFIDSTATVTTVTGDGALDIKAYVDGGGSVKQNTTVNLTASTNDKAGTTSFTWQKKNADGTYTDVVTTKYDESGNPVSKAVNNLSAGITDTYNPATSATGSTDYRCLISREVTTGGESGGSKTATTLLSTKSEIVTVTPKSDPDPNPGDDDNDPSPTVYYTVTLPTLTGATTDPKAGGYDVESWGSFGFFLTLEKDYDQSKPIVTTSDGKTITPRTSDGKYVISSIRSDLSVSISGIVKNNATGNDDITTPLTRVWGSRGTLHVSQPVEAEVMVYTFGGALLKSALLPAGDMQMAILAGSYVVVAGKGESFKVIIK